MGLEFDNEKLIEKEMKQTNQKRKKRIRHSLIEMARQYSHSEAQCNACLIAAAPELLAAAEAALALLRGSGFTESTQTIVLLKAAIEKAGQT
jgi:hypothetical protein